MHQARRVPARAHRARGRVERGRVGHERARAERRAYREHGYVLVTSSAGASSASVCAAFDLRTCASENPRPAPRSHHEIVVHRARRVRERIEYVVASSAGASGTSVRALNDERAESTAMCSSRPARAHRARAYVRLLTCARVQVRTLAMHHEAIVSSEAIVRREFIVHQTHRVRERVERVVASSAGASSASVCAASDLRTCASERERCGRVERRCVERDRVRAKHVVCENTRPTGRMRVPQFPPSPQFPVVVRAATT